jgi:hypothetical protein
MRGNFEDQSDLLSYMTLEERVPAGLPLRKVRELRCFARWIGTSANCTRSIPPEELLSALLL